MGIVTAYNPRSSRLTVPENAGRNEQLSEELARRGLTFYPSLATDPTTTDSSWDEPGFAVIRAPFGEVVRIAADLDQNAIVWVDSHDVARLVVTRAGFCGGSPGEFLPL